MLKSGSLGGRRHEGHWPHHGPLRKRFVANKKRRIGGETRMRGGDLLKGSTAES